MRPSIRWLAGISIKRKLVSIIMLTSSVALVLACAAFVTYELILFPRAMVRDLRTLAQIIADNCMAPLSFNDPAAAESTLRSLRANPHLVQACILTRDGKLFASFPQPAPAPAPRFEDAFQFRNQHLELYWPIVSEGETIGVVYLKSDLEEMHMRLNRYLVIAVVVVLVASGVAFVLSSGLQRVISRPILHLAHTTRKVSAERNYSLRAQKGAEDELGELIDGFNHMLEQIQARDAALQTGHDELEKRVEERTRELQQEITVRAEAEETLKALAAQLQRSNRELQDFAYVASHDLQEPLRKVQAFGDRLKTKCGPLLTTEGKDYVERMQGAARRMQNLITDLLQFSHVTTQAKPFESVDLSKVASEVISDLEVRIQQTAGAVKVEMLPTIEADPVQMRQLLQNLISNGLKFHRAAMPPVVKISSRPLVTSAPSGNGRSTADHCEILVEDNGIGFDEKYLGRIFAVFQRLHNRETYEGTGIGLAICRKITERHGGSITARSTPGQGATFIITLPLRQTKERLNET